MQARIVPASQGARWLLDGWNLFRSAPFGWLGLLLGYWLLMSILSVVPLVIATGAGASARKSIGITVFTGMIASTCLAVLFVPTFYVVVQRFENWLGERKQRKEGAQVAPQTPAAH